MFVRKMPIWPNLLRKEEAWAVLINCRLPLGGCLQKHFLSVCCSRLGISKSTPVSFQWINQPKNPGGIIRPRWLSNFLKILKAFSPVALVGSNVKMKIRRIRNCHSRNKQAKTRKIARTTNTFFVISEIGPNGRQIGKRATKMDLALANPVEYGKSVKKIRGIYVYTPF